jgi:inosine-uridine nucleoside N-ribohydrolase
MVKIHLDTDIGGDIDDFCALAMLLRLSDVEITGITTVTEVECKRAGYVRHVLDLEQREDIPVAAGADASLGGRRWTQRLLDDERYWGEVIRPSPNPLDRALSLLKKSVEQGATIVGIGPYTNLYLLEKQAPGILRRSPLFLMGGYIYPVREGFPQRGNESDYNIQEDSRAAQHIIQNCNPTLVPLSVTLETSLRRAFLDSLKKSGALGQLLAKQAEAYAIEHRYEEKYGRACRRLPSDTLAFLHDPLACAVAVGWNVGIVCQEVPLRLETREGWLHEEIEPSGKPTRIVTSIDASRFNRFWLDTVTNNPRSRA